MTQLSGIILLNVFLTTAIISGSNASYNNFSPNTEEACDGSNPQDFLLKRSNWYSYEGHIAATTAAVGASDQDAQLDIKCSLKVQHSSECIYTLEFETCSIKASSGNDAERKDWLDDASWTLFTEHPIAFTVNDGDVRSVLAHPNDPLHVVNLKRGFISTIVIGNLPPPPVGQPYKKEHRDVQGLCPLSLTSSSNSVSANKDYSGCVLPYKPPAQLSPFSIFWDMSFAQYLLNSSLDCESRLENEQLIRKITCFERHVNRVDSSFNSKFGEQTSISYELILQESGTSKSGSGIQADQLRVTGIEYEHGDMASDSSGDPNDARELLETLLEETEVELQSIPTFLALVEKMRNLDDLTVLTEEAERCPGGEKDCLRRSRGLPLFLDALVHCNRLPCVKTLHKLHSRKLVSKTFLEYALFSWLRMPLVDHRYFTEFLEMCMSTQTRFCWLGIGGLVRTYLRDHEVQKQPDNLVQVVNVVSSTLGQSCGIKEIKYPPGTLNDQKPNFIMTMLKTLGNMGTNVLKIQPELQGKVLSCAQNTDLTKPPRIVALQTLERFGSHDPAILDEVYSILLNDSLPMDLRVEAYNVLISRRKENVLLASKFTMLLKNDVSKQLKGFIASDMKQLRTMESNSFWTAFDESIIENGIDLNGLINMNPLTTSHVTVRDMSFELPEGMVPQDFNLFGLQLKTSTVFGGLSIIPQSITSNLNLTIFGQVMDFMEVGLQIAGLDTLFIRSSATLSNIRSTGRANFMQYLSLILEQLSPQRRIPSSKKPKEQKVLLNHKWEENIERIYKAYQESHAEHVAPHFMLFMRMLGVDLDYTTFPDIVGAIQRSLHEMNQRQRTARTGADIPFSRTHIMNFVEAEYSFPTLMGSLLNWRTNFTLSVSLDAQLDINVKQQTGKLQFKPRLAATLLNGMILTVPGVTEMGIQCKNSIFSGTTFILQGSAGANQPLHLSVIPPETKQRPLELYRDNYLVHGNDVSLLKDWNAERLNREYCLGEKFLKATGMKVCIKSSHLDVRNRKDKPFYYLAGSASWTLSAEMEDKAVEAYNLNIMFDAKSKDHITLEVLGEAKGSVWRREVPLKVSFNKESADFMLDLKHTDFPEFSFVVSRLKIFEAGQPVGYRSAILVKDDGLQWDIIYVKTSKKEVRQDQPRIHNQSPSDQSVEVHVEEKNLTYKTPYNEYNWKLTQNRLGKTGNLKVDSALTYQNLNATHNWLRRILPNVFWEEEQRKAWLQFRGDWRFGNPAKSGQHKVHHGSHGGHHDTRSHLSIPARVLEVVTHSIHKQKHSMHCFNISEVEKRSGQLRIFANMTYSVWRKNKEGEPLNEISTANLTFARHSWSLEAQRHGSLYHGSEKETTAIYTLTGEKMIAKDQELDGNYIGWWSPESASRFDSKQWHVTFREHLKSKPASESDLPIDSRNEIQEDLSSEENDGHSSEEEILNLGSSVFRNEAIHADVSFDYPYGGRQENITFNGVLQWMGRPSPAYKSFLKTFTLASTLHSLQLDSNSIWTKSGNEKVVLSHHSSLTDTLTQKNHGDYNLLFRKELTPDACMGVLLNHSITAHWLNFVSHVTGNCKAGKPRARVYNIYINADHRYWKELNYNLNQEFDFDEPGGESMNLSSSTMDIKVTGKWDNNKFYKRAEFNSKTDIMPSTIWELNAEKMSGQANLLISAPNEELEAVQVKRKMFSTRDRVEYAISHKDKSEPEFKEDGHVMAQIVNKHTVLVNVGWRQQLEIHMSDWIMKFLVNAYRRISSKLDDPNHELNRNMRDWLKGQTINQYFSDLDKRVAQHLDHFRQDIDEVVMTFESLFGPSIQIVNNAIGELQKSRENVQHFVSQSWLGWAWKYFEIQIYLSKNRKQEHFSKGSGDEIRNCSKVILHPFTWIKFDELPRLKFFDDLHKIHRESAPFTLPVRHSSERVAMVFGPSHVLTFDGQLYTFPDYPSESCAVLLAQDVRGKSFSVISNRQSLFLIFPEMAVTIHSTGRIYTNTSQDESHTPIYSQNRNIHVNRLGSIIRVDSPYLRLDCDTDNEFCAFVLSPLLSGGVIGLLGNADGEKHNEFMSPQKSTVRKASDLGSIYELSGEPACQHFEDKPASEPEDAHTTKRCDRVFKQDTVSRCLASIGIQDSELRPACASDYRREGCPCSISKALAALCAYEGHSLDRCQFQRRPQDSTPVPNKHDSWLIRGTYHLQMVLIVEAHENVLNGGSSKAIKGLETLLENVDETFTSNGGFSSITYALIVYGGEEYNEPHMHTQHKSPWMLQRDLLKSFQDIHFESSKRGDPIAAVEFAASMISYDPHATKVVLLINLDDNPQVSKRGPKHLYRVQRLLERHGAVFYVISSYPLLEHGKKVFGLRADGLIFPTNGASYGDYPRSPAAKLAAGTRGGIFWRNFLEENKNPFFFESLSAEMLARVQIEAAKCRICSCVMSPWWQVHTTCKPATDPFQKC